MFFASAEAKSPAKQHKTVKKRFFTETWGKNSLGARLRTRKVAGRDASLPAPLLSAFGILVAHGTVGALPQTPQGTLALDPARGRRKGTKSPLDPFSRLSWSRFHAPSACSFLVLRLSPCLLPQHSVKNQIILASPQILPATARQSSETCTSDAQHRGTPGHCPAAADPASLGRARSTSACAD